MRNYRDNHAFQSAEIARTAARLRAETLDQQTFVASDYGKKVTHKVSGDRGVLVQRFAAYPTLGTAVFIPDSSLVAAFHVTPDEVTFK